MTETSQAPAKRTRAGGGLSAMLLADLKTMAGGLGIKGTSSMKKAQLIDAIKGVQAQAAPAKKAAAAPAKQQEPASQPAEQSANQSTNQPTNQQAQGESGTSRRRVRDGQDGGPAKQRQARQKQDQRKQEPQADQNKQDQNKQDQVVKQEKQDQGKQDQNKRQPGKQDQSKQDQNKQDQPGKQDKQDQGKQDQNKQDQNKQDQQDDDDQSSRRNRRRRGRDRERTRGGTSSAGRESEPQILDDDVLVPAAGIVDVLDNYAFVRTSGYLPGVDDVYLAMSMVRRFGLRPGDAVTGQVRQPREGERKEKFNPMVRVDSVNGADPEQSRHRPEFDALTPIHPTQQLRMETDAANLTGRMIDLVAPIGKGQRGLIVSPGRAGKTTMLQAIAAAVTANNPDCHLMVVLVDERPEEVTDFERSVKGEVISSTFDRPVSDHTAVAELAIERAKRLVELGIDVVVLLDGLTRLGRAYNLSMPATGRAVAGGMDAASLHPPKRFFGAARNIENGGSLTILATASVESGSPIDEAIFEEVEGAGNLELRLRRDFADQRRYPAIDVRAGGTRREDQLLTAQESAVILKLRRRLDALEPAAAHDKLAEQLRGSRSNVELLMQVQKS